jgi:coenzyme F420-dependent glucose-6-phosphate dehydrogenase
VTEEDIAEAVPHGPDPGPMLGEIRAYAEAGLTDAYVHQIGPDQQGFLDFAQRELLPHV